MAAVAVDVNPARVSPAIAALFPPGTVAAELSGVGRPQLLWDAERQCVARAVATRVAEFAAGRHCAHRAIAQLQADDLPVPAGSDRAPLWPAGLIGSITHDADFAAAAVAPLERCAALGLDAQSAVAVRSELWPEFCTATELALLEGLTPEVGQRAAALYFAAKEAFFKCQYGLSRTWLDFDAVQIDCDRPQAGDGAFGIRTAAALPRALAGVTCWTGRFCWRGGLVLAGVASPITP